MIVILKKTKHFNSKILKWVKWCLLEDQIYFLQMRFSGKVIKLMRGNHNWIQANKSNTAWKWISKKKENSSLRRKIIGIPTWKIFKINLHKKCTMN